jgi:hypothetical protein
MIRPCFPFLKCGWMEEEYVKEPKSGFSLEPFSPSGGKLDYRVN